MLVQIIIYTHMENLVLSVPIDSFLWAGIRCGWVLQGGIQFTFLYPVYIKLVLVILYHLCLSISNLYFSSIVSLCDKERSYVNVS